MRNNLTLIKGRLKKYIIIYKPYKLGFKFRRHGKYIEDITWPRGDTKFIFEC